MAQTFDYSTYASWKGEGAASRWRPRLPNRYLRFLKGVDRTKPILELGCASGAFLRVMRAAGFIDARGIDICPEYAGCEGVEIGDAADLVNGSADGTLGGVVALDVFEHIPQDDLRPLLVTCRAKLARGGRVIFRVPNAGAALGLINQYGDLSHVNAFNEVSVRQLAFDTGFRSVELHAEPFAYPRSPAALAGLVLWPLYTGVTRALYAAYGQRPRIITPNLISVLTKD